MGVLNQKIKLNMAFTLAEVLIVLGIIGVVAEMTIPTLMNNVQDQATKTAWKKAFSELSQAYEMLIVDNGGIDIGGQCNDWDNICLRNLFAQKLIVSKTCDNPVSQGCTVANSKFMDGSTLVSSLDINSDAWPAVLTNSGFAIKFRYHTKGCDYTYPSECGWLQVDVNGAKKPNTMGKDIFLISLAKNKLIPEGAQGTSTDPATDCATGGTGRACAAKFLYQ